MSDIKRHDTTARSSKCVIYNGVVYLAGHGDPDGSAAIEQQTANTLAKIEQMLARAGTGKERLLTAQIFLKNLRRDFEAMNSVWNAWTAPGAAPTRSTFQAEMAHEEMLVEIVVTAALP